MTQQNQQKLAENLSQILNRIEASTRLQQRASKPRLLAVSKKHPVEKIKIVQALGQKEFGESYVQEAVEKMNQLTDWDIVWHFIGPIQSNKTKTIAENFAWVQSVDRMKILVRLNKQRPESMPELNVLLQYKVGGESSKSGANQTEIKEMIEAAESMSQLKIRGLMSIPPPSDEFDQQCAYFSEVQAFYQLLKNTYPQLDTLSMGMSGDLEAAIKSGSTMVRIGTDIFGPRT